MSPSNDYENGDGGTGPDSNGDNTTTSNNNTGDTSNDRTAYRSRSRSHEDRRRNGGGGGGRRSSRSPMPRRHRDHSRDRGRRSDNGGRGGGGRQQPTNKYRWDRTVYVNNIPYETKWPELKDLFRERVGGDVFFCEVFEKSDGRSAGCGAVEFRSSHDADRAVNIMHHYEFNGRKISVRVDSDGSRIKAARELAHTGGGGGGRGGGDDSNSNSRRGRHNQQQNQQQNQSNQSSHNNAAALALAALSQVSNASSSSSSTTTSLLASLLGLSNPLVGMVYMSLSFMNKLIQGDFCYYDRVKSLLNFQK